MYQNFRETSFVRTRNDPHVQRERGSSRGDLHPIPSNALGRPTAKPLGVLVISVESNEDRRENWRVEVGHAGRFRVGQKYILVMSNTILLFIF